MTNDSTTSTSTSSAATQHSLGSPGVVLVGALTAGALSLVALKLFGMEMPTVPPALVLMALAAILVASVRRRWTAAVALLIGLAEAAALVAGAISGLTDGDPAIAVATAVRAVAIGAIVVTGIVVLTRRPR